MSRATPQAAYQTAREAEACVRGLREVAEAGRSPSSRDALPLDPRFSPLAVAKKGRAGASNF
jgi:hypothetical protein